RVSEPGPHQPLTGQKILEEKTILSEVQPWNFRSFQYKEDEGPRGLCSRLHSFCSRWLRPEKHTKAQMLDLVLLEQFLALLPLQMESWVRECGEEEEKEQVELQVRDLHLGPQDWLNITNSIFELLNFAYQSSLAFIICGNNSCRTLLFYF
uniref:SCAN box domain-containing protein n=1 Tax=Naja naja TaxID=35670 RepID=A0A8C6XGT9_NAJNA